MSRREDPPPPEIEELQIEYNKAKREWEELKKRLKELVGERRVSKGRS